MMIAPFSSQTVNPLLDNGLAYAVDPVSGSSNLRKP